MPEVYTYAAKVPVYLGEQSDCSEPVPGLVEKVTRLNLSEIRKKRPQLEELVSLGLPPPNDHS